MSEYVTRAEFESFKKQVLSTKTQARPIDRMPVVKYVSKYWEGEDFSGKPFDKCSAEFLRTHARYLRSTAKWKAKDPTKEKFAQYDLNDAEIADQLASQKEDAGENEDSVKELLFG